MHEFVCNWFQHNIIYEFISSWIKAYSILGFDSILMGADLHFSGFIVIIKFRLNPPIQQGRGFDRFESWRG